MSELLLFVVLRGGWCRRGVWWTCLAGGFCWQDVATDLPAPKKSLERPAAAVMTRVSFLGAGLLQASRADVAQGYLVAGLAHLVRGLLGASFLFVELNNHLLLCPLRGTRWCTLSIPFGHCPYTRVEVAECRSSIVLVFGRPRRDSR